MNYTNLGTSGLRVSRICLGMMGFGSGSDRPWVIDEEAAEPIVKAAVEGGVTFFDTADAYSGGASEVATGRLVPKFLSRDEVVIGTSSMFSWQFAKAQYTAEAHGWTKFVSMQNHYNLVYREEEREMIPLCLDQGVGCIPWSPLARGMLAGTRTRDGGRHTTRSSTDPFTDYLYDQPTDFDVVDAAAEVAAARGVPTAQVSLAWVLSKPGVTAPIVGSTRKKHL